MSERAKSILLGFLFLFFVVGEVQALVTSILPSEITLSCETPEKEEEGSFTLFLVAPDAPWMLYASLKNPPPEGTVFLKIPQRKDPIPLSHHLTPILGGREALPEGAKLECTVAFAPPWTLEAGTYTATLVLYSQREGSPPLPIPQGLSLSLEVHKAFAIETQNVRGGIVFEVFGPPGQYPIGEPFTLVVRANVTPWVLLCTTQGLTGERGEHIPPSRIFVEVGGKQYSLEKPVKVLSGKAGEVAVLRNALLLVETTPYDPPGRYTGEISFAFSSATKGGAP
ncbi:MAG: hypothetical protein QW512_04465 [Thermofilaceae archaeon]